MNVFNLAGLKKTGKQILCFFLARQVVRLRKKRPFKLICVVGSVGKTSTKIAIARVLSVTHKVQWQEGNYNDPVTVPLIFFGRSEPHIFNIFGWLLLLVKNEIALLRSYPYDFVVAELGTDTPGTIAQFAYLQPDLNVVTAVSPEHMEYFGTLDAVAQEELASLEFSQQNLLNVDDIPAKYIRGDQYVSYGMQKTARYNVQSSQSYGLRGQQLTLSLAGKMLKVDTPLLGNQGIKTVLAATAVADMLGIAPADIITAVATVGAFAGRMQILPGVKNSVLIDDTYNSSPLATNAALDVLQAADAPQRIAILGSMNELGEYAQQAHREVGEHCDPSKLDLLVTLGEDATKYLAPVAKARGCRVNSFLNPYEVGEFVSDIIKPGAVVLAKGSQNRVFAEESLKALLAHKEDESKLVRQSSYWMAIKEKQFRR